jgi:hypothetical protein
MCAQLPNAPIAALTPNAASLGLYGEIPVSLFTGTPNISIPLYNIEVKNFTLPVTLNYHAAGIRPDQRAGWTGLGWTLNVGGIITRNVNDMADEFNKPKYYMSGNAGYYYNYNVLNTSSWNQRAYLRSIAQNKEQSILKDTEPDEFSFYFSGYSGKFYLDHNRNWVVQCDKPVKIEFNGNFLSIPFDKSGTMAQNYDYFPCFSGFTIIAEDGTKYVFGGDTNSIDFSIGFFNQNMDDWIATGWYLTKIILPTKHEINLTYERKEFNNQMYIAVHHDLGSYTEASGGLFNPQPECSSWSYSSVSASYSGKLLSPVYLTEITTDNISVFFQKSISNELKYAQSIYDYNIYNGYDKYPLPLLKSHTDGYPNCLNNLKWYKLDSVIIRNKTQTETLKTIAFNYNNVTTQRLVLNSITESGKNPYSFSYNNIENLPDYLSNKTDHWGFYNNNYAHLDYAKYYSYRNPDANYTKYGVLEKIVYPTGGYTEFEFEPHCYGKQLSLNRWESCNSLSSNQLAGGVRIKRIKNSSTQKGTSQIFKEYYYVTDYVQNGTKASISSGVLGGQVQYYFNNYVVYAFNDSDVKRKMSAFSSISVLPSCYNTLGSHIGYTEVIEKRPDNSFTRYQFTNFDNGYMDESADAIIQQSRTPYEPYASNATDRGNLILCEDYNANGAMIKKKSILYEKDNKINNYVRAMNAQYKNVCPNTGVSYDEGTSYKIYTCRLRPKTVTETIYDSDGQNPVATTTDYTYNAARQLRQTKTAASNGDTIINKQLYVSDLPAKIDSIYKKMEDKNMVAIPIESLTALNGRIIEGEYRKYAEVYPEIFMPEQINLLPNNITFPLEQIEFYNNEGTLKISSSTGIEEYAEFMVMSEDTVTLNVELEVLSYPLRSVNGYRMCISLYIDGHYLFNLYSGKYKDSYPLKQGPHILKLKIDNVDYQEYGGVCKYSFTEKVSTIRNNLSCFKPEMYYQYDNKGNIRESKHAGNQMTAVYLWGYNGLHPIAEIRNVTYSQIESILTRSVIDNLANSSNPDISVVNSLRNNPNLPNAQVTTYTYTPLSV